MKHLHRLRDEAGQWYGGPQGLIGLLIVIILIVILVQMLGGDAG